jgi:RNA polymerase sigma-70 factor (ECF subfamily)
MQDSWFRLCLNLLGNADDAQDATQETALRFLKQLPRYAGQSHIRTWTLGIALNVTREMRRRRPTEPQTDGVWNPQPGPDVQAELAEQQVILRTVLADLPQRQREALILRYFEDCSVQDAAAAMGCAPGTIKATVFQALRTLRRKLMSHKNP